MKYTHIIWDFNGTIIDDVATGIESTNTLLKRRGLPTIDTIEFYHSVFGFPITDYYLKLGFDFEKESYDDIAVEWTVENVENIKKAPLHNGIKEALEYFKNAGVAQLILSASKKDLLCAHLKDLGIENYFDPVLGLDNIHAASKVFLGTQWLEQNPNAVPLMLGDTVHDAEVAEKIGCDCILIAKGHQSKATLASTKKAVFDDIASVLKAISLHK